MKNSKVAVFVKHVVSVLSALAKSKSVAIRDKTGAMKAKIMLFSLMKSRKLSLQGRLGLGAISHKIHALLAQHAHDDGDAEEEAAALAAKDVAAVISNRNAATASESTHIEAETMSGQYLIDQYSYDDDDDDNDKYPDLRHSLFDEEEEEEEDDPNASVIEMVRSSKEDEGEMFRLEDEIDHVADLFIQKFHKRMRLQKLESFKRLQEMIQRSA
ncbi:PREDICTED: uncharacterized protein LOC109175427 [Ipomoea nil]|uniref:uncharacterized protein LOC109175427 n=1 Tax=Ipomoea nil TaxID=35883 RepID=UPI000901A765|nr:PREDICTED: uncharacterized protein LOC109175427 [Ipomoea nil]